MSNGVPSKIDVAGIVGDDNKEVIQSYLSSNASWFIDFGRIAAQEFTDAAAQIVSQSLQDAKMGTLRLIQSGVLQQVEAGNKFITMPQLVNDLRNDPIQAAIYEPVINYFDRLFNNGSAVERDDILSNDEFFAVGIGLATEGSKSTSGEFSWQVTDQNQIENYANIRNQYVVEVEEYEQRADLYGDALFDQLQLDDDLRDEFDEWWDGYIADKNAEMPGVLFDAVYDDQGPTMQEALGVLGSIDDFDISNLPSSDGQSDVVNQALVDEAKNQVFQDIITASENDPYRLIKRPANTGIPEVDELIDQLWGDITFRSASGMWDVLGPWLQENNTTVFDVLDTIIKDANTPVDQQAGTGTQTNPDGSTTGTADEGVTNDPVTEEAGGTEGSGEEGSGAEETQTDIDIITLPGGGVDPGDDNMSEQDTSNTSSNQELTNLFETIFGLLTGGGGSVNQSQANLLYNIIKDIIGDITVTGGDQTLTGGDQTTTVGDTSASVGDTSASVGDTTQTIGDTSLDQSIGDYIATIGDQTAQVGDVTSGDVSLSDVGNVDFGGIEGSTATVGDVTTGDLSADVTVGDQTIGDLSTGDVTVGDVAGGSVGDTTQTIGDTAITGGDQAFSVDEGAITNTIGDLLAEGAVQAAGGEGGSATAEGGTATIEEGALSNVFEEGALQGGAGGAGGAATIEAGAAQGGAGGSATGGTASSTIAEGAVQNVFDTSGIGEAVSSLGDTIGGFGGTVLDFLGNFLGSQQSTQGQVSENSLAGILAQEAANRYIADKAAESQQNILDFQKAQYADAIARLQPFYDMGVTQAMEVLPEYIDAAKRDIEYTDIDPFNVEDPALRFLQDEARRAVENSAAARGRLNTGGTLTDLQDRAANVALARAGELVGIRDRMNQESRLRDEYDFNKLGRLVGGAQNAANVMTGSDQYYSGLMTPYAESMYEVDAGEAARRSQNYYNIFKDLFGI